MSESQVYIYRWRTRKVRAGLAGRRCRVVARGKLNSVLVEWIDAPHAGGRDVVSRYAVRKVMTP